MKKTLFFCLAAMLAVFTACGGGGDQGGRDDYPRFASGDNTIVQFNFPAAKNPSLSSDVAGTISDGTISATVPYNADVTRLVAEFVSNSSVVEVNEINQQSGITSNDYSGPVAFAVTAENGEIKTYTVNVTKAPSTEKKMLSFSLNGSAGTVNEEAGTISVDLPPLTTLASLVASFSSTGTAVRIGETVQESGNTHNNFTSAVEYTVVAQDGSRKIYTVTATVLPDTRKEITSFAFIKDENKNTTLITSVNGSIDGTSIAIELPYGSSLADPLCATFETTGKSVMIGDDPQVSGSTPNNFSEEKSYRVIAEDGTYADYSVIVTVGKNYAKSITSFSLDGEPGKIEEINETTGAVTVDLPSGKVLTSLVASFVSTGVSIKVNTVEQESGITANDYTDPVSFNVTAENGTVKTYTVSAVKKADIAGLWNFEGSGDGTYQVFEATTTTGIMGDALLFDGYNDYVRIADSDTLSLAEAGTIEALVWINEHKPFAGIVHKGVKTDFSDEAYSLQFWTPTGILRFSIFNDAGDYAYVDSGEPLSTGKWYYLAATWNSEQVVLYIDGAVESSITNTIGTVRDTGGDLVIGAQLADVHYNTTWRNLGFGGIIDRVQIHNRALTGDEIAANYDEIVVRGGEALAAYLLAAVKSRGGIIFILLGMVVIVLAGLYLRNRKRASAG
jgi:hypothetical protein